MAVLHVNRWPISGSRRGSVTSSVTTYSVTWHVITNDVLDGPQVASTAVDPDTFEAIPSVGDTYAIGNDVDATAVVESIEANSLYEDGYHWLVTAQYSSAAEAIDNPLLRPAEVRWSGAQFNEPLALDLSTGGGGGDGKPVVTTAGEPINPLPEVERSRPVLTVSVNKASFDVTEQTTYENAVNATSFHGFGVGTIKADPPIAEKLSENNIDYWKVTYVFKLKRDGWRVRPLNAGLYVKNAAGDGFVQLRDDGDLPLSKPVAINFAGTAKLDPADATKSPSDGGPVYLDLQGYKEISLAPLAALFSLV